MTLPPSWFWISGHRTVRENIFIVLSHQVCYNLLQQPQEVCLGMTGDRELCIWGNEWMMMEPTKSEQRRTQQITALSQYLFSPGPAPIFLLIKFY